jgi:DNA-binding NarL/FixJ family response regulator
MAALVYLCGDLFFVAKIQSVAEELRVSVEGAADAEALVAAARGARLVVVDLRRSDALRALELLAADPEASRVRSIGFVDHENVEAMRAAGERGCARMVSKRKLASELPELVAGCLAG